LVACREHNVPVVMRCPNYRLLCPNGLHLSRGELCERCLGGREYWCVLRNCERSYLKSLGYALRNAAARITRTILNNVDVFIVLSQFQRQRFIDGGIPPERIEVMPNAVQPGSTGTPGKRGDKITFVGRASPEKGIEDFVAAARLCPELPFVIAGATERMPDLVRNSPENISWLGFLKGDELREAFQRSRIIVMPSRCFEGFPNAVVQGMAAGKPVIASALGGTPEIVEHNRTGLLFKVGDVQDLASQIRNLYANPALCGSMGENGRQKALSHYAPEVVYQRLMEIYAKAIAVAGTRTVCAAN
jgi:glycosyltransferase involved in cell wall biosynthesis